MYSSGELVSTYLTAKLISGFEMRDQGGNFQTYGIGGVNLHQIWGETPEAYYGSSSRNVKLIVGLAVSGFPNFMMMFGPNAGAPWANLTTVFETQAVYVTKMIRHIRKQTQKSDRPYSLMVEAGVQKEFNEWIQSNMGALAIVSPNCSNYYTVCVDRNP